MDPYEAIARYYDLEHEGFNEDIDFYLESIESGPVLEVGAGTGRVMAPLLRSGLEVCGIEPSSAMLDRARDRIDGLLGGELCQTSIERFASDRRFATAIFSLNALWHLPTLDQQAVALRVIRRHLVPRGLVMIDQTNPLTMADRRGEGLVRERFASHSRRGTILGFSSAIHDEAAQTIDLSIWYDEFEPGETLQRTATRLQLRYLHRAELELLLKLAGFTPSGWYGSYDREPYSVDSPNLIVTAAATATS